MKPLALLNVLLFALEWRPLARCNVRFALSSQPSLADQRGHYLACAREDAAKASRLLLIWAARTLG
jgi:hypothetical protein